MAEGNGLGGFLRARRAEVDPAVHGIPRGNGRRVAGLRREEVADLAGVSLDYYIRLEQGRDTHPSAAVLDALARVLRIDEPGRAHLARLTGQQETAGDWPPDLARPGLVELIDQWTGQACLLLGRYRDVLASNALSRAINPNFAVGNNLLREVFLDPTAPERYPDWDQVAAEGVAALRASVGARKQDPVRDQLVDEISGSSQEFARLWARQDARDKPAGYQRFQVREVGTVRLRYEPLAVPFSAGQILYVFFADPGSDDARRLARLAAQ